LIAGLRSVGPPAYIGARSTNNTQPKGKAMNSTDAGAAAAGGAALIVLLIQLTVLVLIIVSLWKVFTKAGQPGWGALIPIYNIYLLCKIAGKPGWWVILCFIPLVNILIALLLMIGVAQNFGKGAGFGIGLFFLGFIFFPILAFGDARYGGASEA
jgi:hypothetical protein